MFFFCVKFILFPIIFSSIQNIFYLYLYLYSQPSVFSRAQNLNNDNSRMQREQACVESDNTEDNKVLRHERESLRARNTELFDENKKLQ